VVIIKEDVFFLRFWELELTESNSVRRWWWVAGGKHETDEECIKARHLTFGQLLFDTAAIELNSVFALYPNSLFPFIFAWLPSFFFSKKLFLGGLPQCKPSRPILIVAVDSF